LVEEERGKTNKGPGQINSKKKNTGGAIEIKNKTKTNRKRNKKQNKKQGKKGLEAAVRRIEEK